MALRSMTGYGHSQRRALGLEWTCDVRSVNHKGLEVRVSAPAWLLALEGQVQEVIRRHLSRGRVHVNLHVEMARAGEDAGGEVPLFDAERARQLLRHFDQLRTQLRLSEPVRLEHLLTFPGVIRRVEESVALEEAGEPLGALLEAALVALNAERDREGQVLAQDFLTRLDNVQRHIDQIAQEVPQVRDALLARLRERLAEPMRQLGLGEIPEERLLQEVILYADRSDITEEITRARAHIARLRELIERFDPAQEGGGVGKKMDFYFQELIRETNTMGSKSQNERIAVCVVENRSEIDRMREQVLNIE